MSEILLIVPTKKAPPLPAPLTELINERNRVANKLGVVAQLAPNLNVQALKDALQELDAGLAEAIVKEAGQEIEQAKRDAQAVGDSLPSSPLEAELARQKRELESQERELTREREAEKQRQEEISKLPQGADRDEQQGELNKDRLESDRREKANEKLRRDLEKAEREVAKADEARRQREADALARRAEAEKQGTPPAGEGRGGNPGPTPTPTPTPTPAGGGVGGTPEPKPDEEADDETDAEADAEANSPDDTSTGRVVGAIRRGTIPPPTVLYVKGEKSVWAWNRSTQTWDGRDFGSAILSVQKLDGGILVIAEHQACIYDFIWGKWLSPLETTESLTP